MRLPKHCNVLEMNIADVSSTAPLALEVDERPLCERLMAPVWQEGFARIFSAKIAVAINSVQTLSMVLGLLINGLLSAAVTHGPMIMFSKVTFRTPPLCSLPIAMAFCTKWQFRNRMFSAG